MLSKDVFQEVLNLANSKHLPVAIEKYCSLRKHHKPNITTLAALIKSCQNCNQIDNAAFFWNDMQRMRISPDANCYATLAAMSKEHNKGEIAWTVVKNLEITPVSVQASTWANLLKAMCSGKCDFNDVASAYTLCISRGIPLNTPTHINVLKECSFAGINGLKLGEYVHKVLCSDKGTSWDVYSYAALISMYTKCGAPSKALDLWTELQNKKIRPSVIAYVSILAACSSLGSSGLPVGNSIYLQIMRSKVSIDTLLGNSLLNMFSKCGASEQGISFWQSLCEKEFTPDEISYVAILSMCATTKNLTLGRHISQKVASSRYKSSTSIRNTLINMFTKCGDPNTALSMWSDQNVQPDTITYTNFLHACASVKSEVALEIGLKILKIAELCQIKSDIQLDVAIFNMLYSCGAPEQALGWWKTCLSRKSTASNAINVCALRACALSGPKSLQEGKIIHRALVSQKVIFDTSLYEALLQMYVRCGETQQVAILWKEAVGAHHPLSIKLCTVFLGACADVGATARITGREIHDYVVRNDIKQDEIMKVALLHMYAKCGNLSEAEWIYENTHETFTDPNHQLALRNALLSAYANFGSGEKALSTFHEMVQMGLKPNSTSFVSLLTACSHAGMVHETLAMYDLISQFNIIPSVLHQNCVVDALGRSGKITEALDFIIKNCTSSIISWTSLLGACRLHKNLQIAQYAAEKALQINPNEASVYVLLANTYAATGDHHGSQSVYDKMQKMGIKKIPGLTSVFVNNQTHTFFKDDQSAPQQLQIAGKWKELNEKLLNVGYVPDISWVLQNKSTTDKIDDLCKHSEKMALCFALIALPPGTPIEMDNNLRMCGDCHTAIGLTSKVENRKITVRDSKRFHVFENGKCSCNGFY